MDTGSKANLSAQARAQLQRLQRGVRILGAVLLLTLACVLAWQVRSDYTRNLQFHRERLQALAVVMAANAEAALRAGAGVLNAANLVLRASGGAQAVPAERLHQLLRDHLRTFPAINGIPFHEMWVVDAQGRMVATSAEHPLPAIDLRDRPYFLHHQKTPGAQLYVSPLIYSRVTHLPIIPTTMRIDDDQGRFAGVLGVSLRASYFERTYSLLRLGEDSSIALVRKDGSLLFRLPLSEKLQNLDLSGFPPHQAMLQQDRGSMEVDVSLAGGEPRLVGFKQGEDFPLLAVVAQTRRQVLAPWRSNVVGNLVVAGFALLLIVGFLWFSSRQLRQLQALTQISLHDALTGLPNRRLFDRQAQVEWSRAIRMQQPFSLLYLDIDDFKAFNDHYGHDQGDECLHRLAEQMEAALQRPGDLLARYGGEEFVCLLPNTDATGAHHIAQRLMQAVRALALPHVGSRVADMVTVSVGAASALPRTGQHLRGLLRCADEALYEAKKTGRNRAVSVQADDEDLVAGPPSLSPT